MFSIAPEPLQDKEYVSSKLKKIVKKFYYLYIGIDRSALFDRLGKLLQQPVKLRLSLAQLHINEDHPKLHKIYQVRHMILKVIGKEDVPVIDAQGNMSCLPIDSELIERDNPYIQEIYDLLIDIETTSFVCYMSKDVYLPIARHIVQRLNIKEGPEKIEIYNELRDRWLSRRKIFHSVLLFSCSEYNDIADIFLTFICDGGYHQDLDLLDDDEDIIAINQFMEKIRQAQRS